MTKGKSALIAILMLVASLPFSSCARRDGDGAKPSPSHERFVFDRKPQSPIVFLSTQFNPVEEAARMRNDILKDFPGTVDFRPNDNSYIFNQISQLEIQNPDISILVGALHGDLVKLQEKGSLMPVDAVYSSLADRKMSMNLVTLSRLDGTSSYYVPWMQASFVMVANKKALKYLPKGAALGSLTYDQLAVWAKNVQTATKKAQLGFPAGEKGLMHRFLQGYLYPSFTGSTLLRFRSADARVAWAYLTDLWQSVDPGSLTYTSMDEPLLLGDVWIAWDHTARLLKVFTERPDDFVAFPAPIGPKGRGFMTVVSGLAIPKGMADTKSLETLIDYLTEPAIQVRTALATGFFPVLDESEVDGLSGNMRQLSAAVSAQLVSERSIPTLLPVGLGESNKTYNELFMLTFSAIVLERKDSKAVLDANAKELQAILDQQNIRCWLPDVSGARPCKIE